MKKGVVSFARPEQCPLTKTLKDMDVKKFGLSMENFSGLKEFGEVM